MSSLSLEQFLLALPSDADPKTLKALELSKRSLAKLPPTSLGFMKCVRKVMLTHNELVDITPLATLPALAHLDVSHNQIRTLKPLSGLPESAPLAVLNVSHNQLKSLEGITVVIGKTLKALIAAENQLIDVSALANIGSVDTPVGTDGGAAPGPGEEGEEQQQKPRTNRGPGGKTQPEGLNTLVLSHNAQLGPNCGENAEDLWNLITRKFTLSMRKLALADCGLTSISPTLSVPLCNELRLAKNLITEVPYTVILRSIKILDISHNQFENLLSLKPMKYLQQLSIMGNPVVKEVANGSLIAGHFATQVHVSSVLQRLTLLDSRPFTLLDRDVVQFAKKDIRGGGSGKGTATTTTGPTKRNRDDNDESVEKTGAPSGELGGQKDAVKKFLDEEEEQLDVVMEVPKDIQNKNQTAPQSVVRKIQHLKKGDDTKKGSDAKKLSDAAAKKEGSTVADRLKAASDKVEESAGW